jgi:hypothetical protein
MSWHVVCKDRHWTNSVAAMISHDPDADTDRRCPMGRLTTRVRQEGSGYHDQRCAFDHLLNGS